MTRATTALCGLLLCGAYVLMGCAVAERVSVPEHYYPRVAAGEVGLDPEKLGGLVDLARGFVDEGRIVGAEMLVIKDRRTVLHEAIGWSDLEQKTPLALNSIYRMRSMTKPFTGTAAMMLIDEGRLRLDSRVGEYIESWDNERCGSITVEQLLAHKSGFEQGGWPIPAMSVGSLRQIVDACGEQGPQHAPGERFIYSDVNSFTLGAIVAHISGWPVEDFIQSRILDRLGLEDTHSAFAVDAPWAARMNPTYWRDEESGDWTKYWSPDQEQEFRYFRASGGLYSTVGDYARWLACWMDGTRLGDSADERLVSQKLVDKALSPYGSDAHGAYGYHWGVDGGDLIVFGHSGSDGTLGLAVPSMDLIVLYFTQSRGNDTLDEWRMASWMAVKPG